ncbi:ExbD/TolR family protein [Shewanella cyperi]|nr:biopolymer transporter ExbD [Shewanella cyperi]
MSKTMSAKERRLLRARKRAVPGLNLVSLMDIFTILVFFLLVNSSDIQQPPSQLLTLPEAHVDTPVSNSLILHINSQGISIQGRKIAQAADLENDAQALIQPLFDELTYQQQRHPLVEGERTLTIMGDRAIPYKLLKKIMSTATEAGYEAISMVVISQAVKDGQ